jgi:ring-1,2-phenylacetyl-CoA epoxidase subunit PaaD
MVTARPTDAKPTDDQRTDAGPPAGAARRTDAEPTDDQRTDTRRTDAGPPAGAAADQAEADGLRGAGREWTCARARRIAGEVPDPELPMLTLADLGVLRDVEVSAGGPVTVSLTPTYSGCPALAEMRADVAARLRAAGFREVRVRTVLNPAWTTDWITPTGRRALAEHGIAPPGPAVRPARRPVPLELFPTRPAVPCPRCGSEDTEETARFGATSCKALRRCRACLEPFEHLKEI